MGKSTHTWFLAVLSRSVLCLLSRFQSGSLCFCVLCFCEDSLPLIIIIAFHHISQGCSRGVANFLAAGASSSIFRMRMRRTIREMRRTGRWKISNSIATQHTPWHENSTPRSSRVYAFPPLTTSSRSISMLNRGLCDCCSMYICVGVCVWNIYCTNSTVASWCGGVWLTFFFISFRVLQEGDVSMRLIHTLPPSSQLQWVSFCLMISHLGVCFVGFKADL